MPALPSVSVPSPMAPMAATLRMPWLIVVAPVRVLVPPSVSVPAPLLVNAAVLPVPKPFVKPTLAAMSSVPPLPAKVMVCVSPLAAVVPV